ncbi:hypothetical protein SOPP22_02355 [Shewanella sp. OPT22]|uniref:PH domain-containing protein n=1 Tax=Parashewanella hymeniacidonis TaxID=2807618 RepID=UPI00101F6D75|nr:PH domain-containing protein [Parashewanella hymeniacidonis]MBM7070963.1 hypothetical protein [Parashewanella hymeniacidonis]RYV03874.1 hypothetical protein SOPP22_02355 [Shewanella sp. OPT22]
MDAFRIPLSDLHTTGLWWFIAILALLLIVLSKGRNALGWFKYLWLTLLAMIFGSLCYVFIHSFKADIEISESNLEFDVPLYSKSIPLRVLDIGNAQIVDLTQSKDFQIKFRQNGIGLPGYQLGYFQLDQPYHGATKALLSVTAPTKVIVLPTKENLLLIFSVDHPQQALSKLKQIPRMD